MHPPSSTESIRTEFAYDFAGPIQHVYATIAVSLALTDHFGEARYWADCAEYRLPSGEFFGLSIHRGDRKRFGKGEIEIYFSPESPEHLRQDFYAAVVSKLAANKIQLHEKQKRTCETTGKLIPPAVLDAWREQGISKGPCPMCQKHEIHLWSPLHSVEKRRTQVQQLERASDAAATRGLAEVQRKANTAPEASKRVRILHLTDLHFLPDEEADLLAQPLLTDLNQKQSIKTVDFLVVSGDFSDKCNSGGFKAAKDFIRYLIDKHLIESPERLILVPGNHDQLRDRSGFIESDTPDPAFSRKTDFGNYFVRGPQYMDRFRHWFDLYKDLTKGDYPLDAKNQFVDQTFIDHGVQFLSLNTAWQTDILQPRIGSLQPVAVARAIGKVNPQCLTIAVWHHAPSEWEDESRTKLAYRLDESLIASLANAGVRLVLHGHVHERRSELVNAYYRAKDRMHIMGGGAFGTEKKDRAPGTPRMYNLIEIAQDHSHFTITTRSRAEGHAHFDAYPVWPVPGKPNDKTATLKVDLK